METTALPFESAQFLEVWKEFEQHRKEIGRKMTPLSKKKMLKKVAGWGERRAIEALELSIENGWIGVFEPPQKKVAPMEPEHQKRARIIREREQAQREYKRCQDETAGRSLVKELAERLKLPPEE